MAANSTGSQIVEAFLSVSELVGDTYEKNPADFALDPQQPVRLDYTLTDLTQHVRSNPPAEGNEEAVREVQSHLLWLWGVALSNSVPIRWNMDDARYDKLLGELSWVEKLVENEAGDGQSITQCGNCGRRIPGWGFALCSRCQVDGYRECKNCEQRVASVTNPYCDVCAEEIVGAG